MGRKVREYVIELNRSKAGFQNIKGSRLYTSTYHILYSAPSSSIQQNPYWIQIDLLPKSLKQRMVWKPRFLTSCPFGRILLKKKKKKIRKQQVWQRCRETRTLVHCKWDVKWCSCCGKVWQFIKKLNTNLPHDQATPLLGMYPKEGKAVTQTAICTPMFIAALFTIAKGRSNPSVYWQTNG